MVASKKNPLNPKTPHTRISSYISCALPGLCCFSLWGMLLFCLVFDASWPPLHWVSPSSFHSDNCHRRHQCQLGWKGSCVKKFVVSQTFDALALSGFNFFSSACWHHFYLLSLCVFLDYLIISWLPRPALSETSCLKEDCVLAAFSRTFCAVLLPNNFSKPKIHTGMFSMTKQINNFCNKNKIQDAV